MGGASRVRRASRAIVNAGDGRTTVRGSLYGGQTGQTVDDVDALQDNLQKDFVYGPTLQ